MPDNTPIIQAYLAQNPYKAPQKKKQTGKGGTLTSLISEGGALGGGAAGAAAGTMILPGIGTLIGGAIGAGAGAFTGRLAENKVRDNRAGWGDAAKEGLVTGLLSAPGKGLKVGYNATKTLAKGGALEDALLAANTAASKTGIVGGAANKVRTSAGERTEKAFGSQVGKTQGGKTVKVSADDELTAFRNGRAQQYGGVKAGAPRDQARDAESVLNNVTNKLDSQLAVIDRPLARNEQNAITSGLAKRVQSDAGLVGDNAVAANFHKKITNAKSVRELEDIRKEAQDLAFKQNGAKGDAAVARQAEHARDTIDDFVTNMKSKDPAMQAHIDEYKAVKGDYRNAKQLADNTAKEAGKTVKGIPVPFLSGGITGNGVGGTLVTGTRNKINAKLAGEGATGAVNPTLSAAQKTGARMGATGSLADALINAQPSNNDATMATSQDTSTMPINSDNMSQDYQNTDDLSSPQDQNPYPRENLIADIQRDPANADDYIKLYQQYQEVFAAPETSLTSAQQTRAAAAQNALQDLPLINDAIDSGQLGGAKNIPGSGTAIGRRLLGTENLDAALFNIADNILRARSGAAAPEAEVLRFKNTFLPGPLDSAEAKRFKLDRAMRELQGYVNPQGAAAGNSNELIDALSQSGYRQ